MRYVLAAAVLPPQATPPPGIDPAAYAQALRTDVYDLLDDLSGVTPHLSDDDAATALRMLQDTGATIGAVIAGDAPDLPGLLVGKLFGACEDTLAGVLPADGGGLVGLAARLPLPEWLDGLTLERDLDWLHERAPVKAVQVGPGWHRLRAPEDVARLDPRLEGWAETRALLGGYSSSG